MNFGGLVVGQDVATAVCGLFNAGYFAGYWWRRSESRGRRIGAAALALVSAAAVVEALFSEAMFWSQQGIISLGHASTGVWALVRLPLLAATVLVSGIILRRVVG